MPDSVILKAYRTDNIPGVYIVNSHTTVNIPLFFEIQNPYTASISNTVLDGYEVVYYTIILGKYTFTSASNNIPAQIDTPGKYPLSIKVVYKNGITTTHDLKQDIVVYAEWPVYDYNKTRILTTDAVALPYTLEQVKIKPNEFGVADILNSSILKLNECINYLVKCSTIIYKKTPTKYIGWLGVHKDYTSSGLRWYTTLDTPNLSKDYDKVLFENNDTAFNNITDIKIVNSELYVADIGPNGDPRLSFGLLNKNYIRSIYTSTTSFLSQLKNIASIEVNIIDDVTRSVYLLDSLANKLYKVTLYLDTETFIAEQTLGVYGNLEQSVGGFGSKEAASRFYSPTQLHCKDNCVYVVDANNFCVKKFTINLGWIVTYFIEDFLLHLPISIAVATKKQYQPSLIYILTITGRIYILNQDGSIYNEAVPYIEVPTEGDIKKIILDYAEEFIYVIYKTHVLKYSILGMYISVVEYLPTNTNFLTGTSDKYRNIYIADKNKIFKFLDVVEDFSIINSNYSNLMWKPEELTVSEGEFIQDWSVNRVLNRVASNVEAFRMSLHSRYGITTAYSSIESITYYTAIPISSASTPYCGKVLEDVTVGANELVLTQVINRNIEKIYNCIQSLVPYVNATYLTKEQGGSNCDNTFCWSWKSTSCFNISLPVLRICNINPITFSELTSDFTNSYAPSKKWKDAFSECCNK